MIIKKVKYLQEAIDIFKSRVEDLWPLFVMVDILRRAGGRMCVREWSSCFFSGWRGVSVLISNSTDCPLFGKLAADACCGMGVASKVRADWI